jgi:spore germination cell wall hydrolase CwlJ-like protein
MNSAKKDLLILTVGGIIGCLFLLFVSNIIDLMFEKKRVEYIIPLYETSSLSSDHYNNRIDVCRQNDQCRVMAEAIFFEARGEPVKGQYMVGFAIRNRRDSPRWRNTVTEVVHREIVKGVCQFSYVCEINRKTQLARMEAEPEAMLTALDVAYNVYFYAVPDFTGGVDHYYNPAKVSRTPRFAQVYEYLGTIGNHKMYRGIRM